jgi:hypothetical protein
MTVGMALSSFERGLGTVGDGLAIESIMEFFCEGYRVCKKMLLSEAWPFLEGITYQVGEGSPRCWSILGPRDLQEVIQECYTLRTGRVCGTELGRTHRDSRT